jgi:hypothetical protein
LSRAPSSARAFAVADQPRPTAAVNAVEGLDRVRDHRLDVVFPGNVGAHEGKTEPPLERRACGFAAGRRDDLCALLDEDFRDPLADAAGRTSDDGYLSAQSAHARSPYRSLADSYWRPACAANVGQQFGAGQRVCAFETTACSFKRLADYCGRPAGMAALAGAPLCSWREMETSSKSSRSAEPPSIAGFWFEAPCIQAKLQPDCGIAERDDAL